MDTKNKKLGMSSPKEQVEKNNDLESLAQTSTPNFTLLLDKKITDIESQYGNRGIVDILKTLKGCICEGMPIADAKIQALKPIRVLLHAVANTDKGIQSDGSTSLGHSSKRVKGEIYDEAFADLRVGIIHTKFPAILLTEEQIKATLEKIIDLIIEVGKEDKPSFNDFHKCQGWIEITCATKTTAEWLKKHQTMIIPWKGATLKVVDAAEIPHNKIIVGNFPCSSKYSDEKILHLLTIQNAIDVTNWKVLKRTTKDSIQEICFSIDQQSAEKLNCLNFSVGFMFGVVQLSSKSGREQKEKEQTTPLEVPEASTSQQVNSSKDIFKSNTKHAKVFSPIASGSTLSNPNPAKVESQTWRKKEHFGRKHCKHKRTSFPEDGSFWGY